MALAEDTLEDNEAWESYARNRGVTIKSYHAYNGIFKVKRWVELCHIGGQDITFSGGKFDPVPVRLLGKLTAHAGWKEVFFIFKY